MQAHDEERDIYGVVYAQGKKYFLLGKKPIEFNRPMWMSPGTTMWEVADEMSKSIGGKDENDDYVYYYIASYIVVGSDALIDLFPVPLTKKVIRFYVTDDEEA